jgi:predicted metalloprotease
VRNVLARLPGLLAGALALTLVSACVVTGGPTSPPSPTSTATRVPGQQSPSATEVDQAEVDKVVRSAIDDVERYWRETYPAVTGGRPFTPVKGYFPYSRSDPPPACGSEQGTYQPNAFYCPAGDFIAWDEEELIPTLYSRYGPLLVALVMAHEYGHAIQHRLGVEGMPTIVLEQQADCFAGSWVRDVTAGRSDAFPKAKPDQLDAAIAGMLSLRDQPGTSALSPQAHGNAFDRIRAFQEGYEQGARRCVTYRPGTIPITEVPFTDPADVRTGGNLPYAEAVELLSQDLQSYWSQTFPQLSGGGSWEPLRVVQYDPAAPPACDGATRTSEEASGAAFSCPADGFVAFDRALGRRLHEQIGDNAIGILLANLFARAVLERLNRPTTGKAAQLQIDCLSGSWTHSLLSRGSQDTLQLSPGDLDEAVAALLVFGRAGDNNGASSFERVAAYRKGVLGGIAACNP